MGTLPGDACPFSRPFPEGFDECPAYEGIQFQPATFANEPLTPAWSCRHLTVATVVEGFPRNYARCELGDAAARLQWLKDRIAARGKTGTEDAQPALGFT
jgi:hypothetical protein